MMSNCRESCVSSSPSFFSHPQLPSPSQYNPISSNGFSVILESEKPISENPVPVVGDFAGGAGLMSCTESLGFESCDEMICSMPSTSSPSPSKAAAWWSGVRDRRREKRVVEKREFPPPLTSLSEYGRRNFTLKSERRDGRLEIVGVMIQRPEILCSSRQNGRLRLHLVQTAFQQDDVVGDGDVEDNDEFDVEDKFVVVEKAEEQVTVDVEAEEEDVTVDVEAEEVVVVDEKAEEVVDEEVDEKQWRVVKSGLGYRRCYHNHELQGWEPSRQHYVM